jgi:hypothetical protein
MTNSLTWFFKVLCTIFSFKLQVCKQLWVLDKFFLTCSNSIIRFESSCNVLDQVVAFWTTCSKNVLICLKISMEWLQTRTSWNPKNCGFSNCTGSITSWTSYNDYVITTIGSIDITCSTWMLSITWFKLGSSFSSMLHCITIASSFSPPYL